MSKLAEHVPIRFTDSCSPYNAGDSACFREDRAKRYVDAGVAEYEDRELKPSQRVTPGDKAAATLGDATVTRGSSGGRKRRTRRGRGAPAAGTDAAKDASDESKDAPADGDAGKDGKDGRGLVDRLLGRGKDDDASSADPNDPDDFSESDLDDKGSATGQEE